MAYHKLRTNLGHGRRPWAAGSSTSGTALNCPTCTGPKRPETRTQQLPRGRTCNCDLRPACRHDHQCKQAPSWTLTTRTPGTYTWTTPGNRACTTTPAQYPE